MYKKVETDMNFVEREKETAKFWKDNDIFQKSIKQREGDPTYMFFDGPPTANGRTCSLTDRRQRTASRTSATF